MYARDTSQESRKDILINAMREIKLCAIVSATGDGLFASHLPMIIEQNGTGTVVLNGHVSRNNPHWRAVSEPVETVAVFQGAHGYISPSWYQTKAETGKVVPTWGYIAVHAHGTLEVIKDIDWLRAHVTELTALHEADRTDRWAVNDAPDDYIDVMLRGIIGVRLTVERLEGSWKLNQHRSEADQLGAAAGLTSETSESARQLGKAMATSSALTKA